MKLKRKTIFPYFFNKKKPIFSPSRTEVRTELQAQLEAFDRKEHQMEEKRRAMAQERRKLWNTKNSVLCSRCRYMCSVLKYFFIIHKFLSRTPLASAHSNSELHLLAGGGGGARTAGDGQNGLVVVLPKN